MILTSVIIFETNHSSDVRLSDMKIRPCWALIHLLASSAQSCESTLVKTIVYEIHF